jgi:hypothetical protein
VVPQIHREVRVGRTETSDRMVLKVQMTRSAAFRTVSSGGRLGGSSGR